MTLLDIVITTVVLVAFGLGIYLKVSKRKFQDLMKDIIDMIKSMRKND